MDSSSPSPAPKLSGQIPNNLPAASATITTHDPLTRKAIFHTPSDESALNKWHPPLANEKMAFYTLYQTQQVPVRTHNDLDYHEDFNNKNEAGPPLVVQNGTVCRMVDFAPGYATVDHRSLSVDYGVVIEGSIELVLDSGEVRRIERGGMVVQRGTMHLWRNPSETQWARMFFVLISAEPRAIGDVPLEEDLGGL
ncbi:hypothetical protein N7540_005997 [Penicillium herquei]|nr:hypothetical protein N7540_005997 [Penicillium herquei]